MIAPDCIKAFLEDLALVCLRHGIAVVEREFGNDVWMEIEKLDSQFGGFEVRCGRTLWSFAPGEPRDEDEPIVIRSADASTLTAHQRLSLTRTLAEARRHVD